MVFKLALSITLDIYVSFAETSSPMLAQLSLSVSLCGNGKSVHYQNRSTYHNRLVARRRPVPTSRPRVLLPVGLQCLVSGRRVYTLTRTCMIGCML